MRLAEATSPFSLCLCCLPSYHAIISPGRPLRCRDRWQEERGETPRSIHYHVRLATPPMLTGIDV